MHRLRLLNTLILLILSFYAVAGFAQHKSFTVSRTTPTWLQKITTSHKKPATRDIQDGYYLFLYEQQNNLETQEKYARAIREIVSDNGVQNGSEITVTYDPSYQQLRFHTVTIWRNNKAIDKLNASKFKVMQTEKELSKFIYSGTYDAYLILDDVRKGDRIEYSYSLKGENPVFGNKYSNTFYFEGGSQIANIYLNIIAAKNRPLQFKNFNNVPRLKTTQHDALTIYEWQQGLTKTINSLDFVPSWYDPYGRVQISEHQSWKEIVDWGNQLNNYDLKNATRLNQKIAALKTAAKNDKEAYLALATRFVQDEVRYMGIEMGEYSHRPNTPEKVLAQRYGDCKDKSLLLVSLLKGNGITAHAVYVNTYLKDKTKDVLPSTGIFNHEVVVVEFEGKKIWIDPTMSDQGGPIKQNYFPYNANVLVIKPGNDKLEWVASNPTGKLTTVALFKVPDTLEGNTAELVVKSTYDGNYADNLRSDISAAGIDKLEKDFLEYYAKIYPGINTAKDLEIVDDRKKNRILLTEHYDIENIWTKDDSISQKYYAYFYGDMINNELRELNKARNVPFALKYPSNIHQVVKVVLPEKWTIKKESSNIKRKNYQFSHSISYDLDTLLMEYNYTNTSSELSAAETKQYVKDKKDMVRAINYSIYWNGNPDALQEGDLNNRLALLSFVVFILVAVAAIFIYTSKQSFDLAAIKAAPKIGGWLILAGLGIVVSPITVLYGMVSSEIYSQSVWDNLADIEQSSRLLYKVTFVAGAVLNTAILVFSLLMIALFINRRSILPKFYILFRTAAMLIAIIDLVIGLLLHSKLELDGNLGSDIVSVTYRTIIGITWVIYFLRSTRVKQTFVFTYPAAAWRLELIKDLSSTINQPFPNDPLPTHTHHLQENKEQDEKL